MMSSLRQAWLTSGRQYLGLMLDYDGTLTPLIDQPMEARLTPVQTAQLVQLVRMPDRIKMALVSGRSVDQLMTLAPDLCREAIVLAGSHGGHITVPLPGRGRQTRLTPKDTNAILATLTQQLGQVVQTVKGCWLEEKTHSVAVHFRQVADPDLKIIIQQQMAQCIKQYGNGTYRLQPGKDVYEAVPINTNKGQAVRHILDYWPSDLLPVYMGDDLTDEAAFHAVNDAGGLSICVGRSNTAAQWAWPGVDQVYDQIASLTE